MLIDDISIITTENLLSREGRLTFIHFYPMGNHQKLDEMQ